MTSTPSSPLIFDQAFTDDENNSPFLIPSSRGFGEQLRLTASISSALLLLLSFILNFYEETRPLAHLGLLFVYFLAGVPSLIESIDDLLALEINIDVLMTLAAFSSYLIGSGFEGALLLVLFELSGAMEETVTHRAKGALSRLHQLSPTRVLVLEPSGSLSERSVRDTTPGTQILVQAGQVVPLDGRVIEGESSVNLVHLTGENLPLTKKKGDDVPAGARNLEGALTLEVTRSNADSTLSRIINLVTQAQEAKPNLQRWFDSLSRRYAIFIILFAFFLATTLPFFIGLPLLGQHGSIYRALTFLIAASPCALIIALPVAYLSAVSTCARNGILLKGGVTLDALASCRILALDKTGTLTTGKLQLVAIEPLPPHKVDVQEALSVAAALERGAKHPIAVAVMNAAKEQKITRTALHSFKQIPGQGLEGVLEDGSIPVYIGRPDSIWNRLPESSHPALRKRLEEVQKEGELLAILLIGSTPILMRFRDTPRPHMRETIDTLKKMNRWRILMLTGDHSSSAESIADKVGIEEVYANLKPEDKLDHVSRLAEEYGLAMVGDGVNDAPALARATAGICMGKVGSSTAIDAADVVLLHDDLDKLPWLMAKADQSQRIVKQNLFLALFFMLIAVSASLAGAIPLWLAVVLHEGGTVLVGLNALRLLRA